jgi:HSP20 family protein
MTLLGKESLGSISDLQTGINRLFEQLWHSGIRTGPFDGQDWAPPVEVLEKNDRYVVLAELAGVSAEDLEVSCTPSQLTIRGQKVHPDAREEQDHVCVDERSYGSFRRIIDFTDAVRAEDMSAKLEKGLLQVVAPKKTASSTTVVNIPVGE